MSQSNTESEDSAAQSLTQVTYQPSAYADSSWEIVGERFDTENFDPLPLEVIASDDFVVDPMFANYGGVGAPEEKERWHLPESVAYESTTKSKRREAEEVDTLKMRQAELDKMLMDERRKAKEEAVAELALENTEKLGALEARISEVFEDLSKQLS